MLGEMPAAEVGLNELARRVGLAKSNVLRYFESLEAVLLDLLGDWHRRWIAELTPRLSDTSGSLQTRCSRLVDALSRSLVDMPILCDLFSAQSAVLERNVSPEVAARFKRSSLANALTLAAEVTRLIPELEPTMSLKFVAATQMSTGALWSHAHPSVAMLTAYEQHPDLADLRLDFESNLTDMLWILLKGTLIPTARLST